MTAMDKLAGKGWPSEPSVHGLANCVNLIRGSVRDTSDIDSVGRSIDVTVRQVHQCSHCDVSITAGLDNALLLHGLRNGT
jgi:hypothetical protein